MPYQGSSGTIKQQSLIAVTPLKASTLLRVPPSSTEETLRSVSILRHECNQAAGSKGSYTHLASEDRQSVQKRFNPELAQLPLDHTRRVQQFLEVHLGETREKTGFFRAGVAGIAEQQC